MLAVAVYEKDRVKDLDRLMCIQRGVHLGNRSQIAVDKLTQAPIVIQGPGSRSTCHKQFEVGQAERVLHVYSNQANPHRIAARRLDPVPPSPILCFIGAFLVGNTPD